MLALTRQNATNARATPVSTAGSNSRPAANGAAPTSTFFTHCLGRMARTAGGRRCDLTATSVEVDIEGLGYRALATVGSVRTPEPRRLLCAISVVVLLTTGGCGGGGSRPVVPSETPG